MLFTKKIRSMNVLLLSVFLIFASNAYSTANDDKEFALPEGSFSIKAEKEFQKGEETARYLSNGTFSAMLCSSSKNLNIIEMAIGFECNNRGGDYWIRGGDIACFVDGRLNMYAELMSLKQKNFGKNCKKPYLQRVKVSEEALQPEGWNQRAQEALEALGTKQNIDDTHDLDSQVCKQDGTTVLVGTVGLMTQEALTLDRTNMYLAPNFYDVKTDDNRVKAVTWTVGFKEVSNGRLNVALKTYSELLDNVALKLITCPY